MPTKPPCHRPALPAIPDGRGSSAARGYGRRWRKLRESVLRRRPLCEDCLARGLTVAAEDLDHVVARAKGGTDDEANLRPLCHACHSAKTVREDGGFGRGVGGRASGGGRR